MNVLMNLHFRTFILAIVFLCQSTWAQSSINQGMIFEGSLTDNSGNAIDLQSQQLYFYVSAFNNLAEKCILYAESSTSSGDSAGLISHRYGSGNAIVSPITYNNTMSSSVFAGAASGKLADGSGSACSVIAGSTRYVDVYSAVLDITGTIVLGTTPYSKYADNASTLNGKSETDFVAATSLSGGTGGQVLSRVGSTGFAWITPSTGGGVFSVDLSSASATGTIAPARLADVVTAGSYVKVTVDSKGRVTSGAPTISANDISAGVLPVVRGGTGISTLGFAHSILSVNSTGTGYEYKAIAGGSGVSAVVNSGSINFNLNLTSTHVTDALGYTPANVDGDTVNNDWMVLGNMGVGRNTAATRLDVNGSIKVGNGGEACISTYVGTLRYNSGSIELCNGTSWQALAVAGGLTVVDSSIDSAKILDGSIVAADIAPNSVTYNKLSIADGEIPGSKINGLGASFTLKENVVSVGNTTQYYRGDKTWQSLDTGVVSESTNLYYTDSRVRSAPITGYTMGSDSVLVAADTVLQALSKLQGQISARWQTVSPNMYFDTGNVSIGSNTFPGSKLFVKKSGSLSGQAIAALENWEDGAYGSTTPGMTISRRLPAGINPTNGFGSSITFLAEDNGKTVTGQTSILSAWSSTSGGTSIGGLAVNTKDSTGLSTTKIYADQSGVYIPNSNLLVSGSVRIGSDSIGINYCAPNDAGKQRYNAIVKAMEFCDGINWRGINGITYCDTNYSIVGTPGTPSAFCIDTVIGSNQSYENASAICNSRNPSSGSKAKVCSTNQLDTTCESYNLVSPTISNFNNTIYHWTSTGIPVGGTMNYPKNVFVAYNSANPATCHLQPTTGIGPFNGRISDSANLNTTMNFRCCYE